VELAVAEAAQPAVPEAAARPAPRALAQQPVRPGPGAKQAQPERVEAEGQAELEVAGPCAQPAKRPAQPADPLEQCATVTGTSCKVCVSKSVAVTGGYTIDAPRQPTPNTRVAGDESDLPSVYSQRCVLVEDIRVQYGHAHWRGQLPGGLRGTGATRMRIAQGWGSDYAARSAAGRTVYTDYADGTKSQWYEVCSSGAANTYPYGKHIRRERVQWLRSRYSLARGRWGAWQAANRPLSAMQGSTI